MNTLVKKIAAAAAALALAAAVTLSATDAPTVAAIDMSGAEYAVDMGADFAAEDNTQTAFIFLFFLALFGVIGGVVVTAGAAAYAAA